MTERDKSAVTRSVGSVRRRGAGGQHPRPGVRGDLFDAGREESLMTTGSEMNVDENAGSTLMVTGRQGLVAIRPGV